MDTFMVGDDLNSPGQNYDDLIAALKGYGTWWHVLDSTWLIKSSNSATAIRDHLKQYIERRRITRHQGDGLSGGLGWIQSEGKPVDQGQPVDRWTLAGH